MRPDHPVWHPHSDSEVKEGQKNMNIKITDGIGKMVEIDGKQYRRTMVFRTVHGITQRFAPVGAPGNTVDIRKSRLMQSDPETARILFDARNW